MELTQLRSEFEIFKKNIDSVVKLLKEISRLDQDRVENLPQLRARLTKLDEIIKQLGQGAEQHNTLRNWADQYRQELAYTDEQIKKRFGVELEQELKNRGLSLSGQYPDLKAGLFTIELDFEKQQVTLWYGPKQERLDKCPLSVAKVVVLIKEVRQRLGSHLDEEDFRNKLQEAYSRTADRERREHVSIIGALSELAYLLQSPRFHQNPTRENFKNYSRADFSFDLFQHRPALVNKGLHLTVAARAYTRRRQDFLWVPDDEKGKGTTYSHLQFKEAIS